MNIGILGRQPALLARAIAAVADVGNVPFGTLSTEEALRLVTGGEVEAVLVGGGVEEPARTQVLAACRAHGVRGIEVRGPADLVNQLTTLA